MILLSGVHRWLFRSVLPFLITLALTSCTSNKNISFAKQGANGSILIQNINIVDVENNRILKKQDVLITKGIISQISAHRKHKVVAATIINGAGKYLIPGLWDMHVHIADSSYLKLFVVNGVLGIRDMGGADAGANNGCESITHERLMAWRKLIQSGLLIGPRMLISGPVVSNTGWPTSINIGTPEDARMAVKKLKEFGVDFIKVYERIPIDAYRTLAMEAKALGLPIAGHVPVETVSLLEAAEAGQRSIEHIRDPLLMCFTNNREELLEFFKNDNWSTSDVEWGLNRFGECAKTIEALKRNNTWLVPTLTVERAKIAVYEQQFVNDPIRTMLPKSVQQGFLEYVSKKLSLSSQKKKSDSLWWVSQMGLVRRMHGEGIGFLAGTDAACEGGLPGYSLHDELRLFVQAGLTPTEALKTATINPAKYLELTDSLGTIAKGKRADVVILNGNPLQDISNTKNIHAVISNGRIYHSKDLEALKAEVTKMNANYK